LVRLLIGSLVANALAGMVH